MFNNIRLNLMLLIMVFSAGSLFGGDQIAFALKDKIQDPTQPVVTTSSDVTADPYSHLQDWRLSSTLISPGRSIAIINGHVCQQGETLEGAKIVTIKAGAVELRYANSSYWLHASAATVKKIHPPGGKLP